MPFKDPELEQLSKTIINRLVQKQTPAPQNNVLVERLRQSILAKQGKLPKV